MPIAFADTRQLAEEWTYRYLAAASTWATTEYALSARIGPDAGDVTASNVPALVDAAAADTAEPSTAEVRAWARTIGLTVPDRGRLHPDIWQAWRRAHQR